MLELTTDLQATISSFADELELKALGFANCSLESTELKLNKWLDNGYAGELDYMSKHGSKRTVPDELVSGTRSVISALMPYRHKREDLSILGDSGQAYVAAYARGRDYHKVLKKRLEQLCKKVKEIIPEFEYRVFVDSAPVMERALASKAQLGWFGKNTMLINKSLGSFCFIGEIYSNLEYSEHEEYLATHCGTCERCLQACPTDAIVEPYIVDTKKCISFLTIENKGTIPVEFRKLIGNRVFGCDDCQLCCPWNRKAALSLEDDFVPRNNVDTATLLDLFAWTEEDFDLRTRGSAIRRTGYDGWLRNIAVALGNAATTSAITEALQIKLKECDSDLVCEHISWALAQHLPEN